MFENHGGYEMYKRIRFGSSSLSKVLYFIGAGISASVFLSGHDVRSGLAEIIANFGLGELNFYLREVFGIAALLSMSTLIFGGLGYVIDRGFKHRNQARRDKRAQQILEQATRTRSAAARAP
jgi:hypothetical protein